MQKDLLQDALYQNCQKIDDKERILKAVREKKDGNLQRTSHQAISRFLSRNSTDQERVE